MHHDVLVIGGGTAGCVLAARLSEDPDRRVCLVEGFERLRELGLNEPIVRYAARDCAIHAVVDEQCRVLSFEGLLVADASVKPTIPRANTNLTTAAVAERMADQT